MNLETLETLVDTAMQRYDQLILNERDPLVRRLLIRDRVKAEAAARDAIAKSMLKTLPSGAPWVHFPSYGRRFGPVLSPMGDAGEAD
jgi:hypothetical protein